MERLPSSMPSIAATGTVVNHLGWAYALARGRAARNAQLDDLEVDDAPEIRGYQPPDD